MIKDYDYVLSPIKHSKKKKSARRGRRVIVHTMMLLPSESGCSEGLKFVIKSSKRKDQQEELGRNMCSRLQVKQKVINFNLKAATVMKSGQLRRKR